MFVHVCSFSYDGSYRLLRSVRWRFAGAVGVGTPPACCKEDWVGRLGTVWGVRGAVGSGWGCRASSYRSSGTQQHASVYCSGRRQHGLEHRRARCSGSSTALSGLYHSEHRRAGWLGRLAVALAEWHGAWGIRMHCAAGATGLNCHGLRLLTVAGWGVGLRWTGVLVAEEVPSALLDGRNTGCVHCLAFVGRPRVVGSMTCGAYPSLVREVIGRPWAMAGASMTHPRVVIGPSMSVRCSTRQRLMPCCHRHQQVEKPTKEPAGP